MQLKHFQEHEFNGWYSRYSPVLLERLDNLRDIWGRPILISRADGATGRKDSSNSRHNANKWGEVQAIDILPSGVTTKDSAETFYMAAKACGFGGIGLYTDWRSGIGFHVDVRPPNINGDIATWGRVKGQYTTLEAALNDI